MKSVNVSEKLKMNSEEKNIQVMVILTVTVVKINVEEPVKVLMTVET